MGRTYVVDFDDLCDATVHRLDQLCRIKTLYTNFQATLFAIPKRCSQATIDRAKSLGQWLHLAPHGWRHTRGECLAWTDEEAYAKLQAAAEMGINHPAFRAPGWLLDADIYTACKELGYVVADHAVFNARVAGTRVYCYNDAAFRMPTVVPIHGHLSKTPATDNFIDDMCRDGRLDFTKDASFISISDAAVEAYFNNEDIAS